MTASNGNNDTSSTSNGYSAEHSPACARENDLTKTNTAFLWNAAPPAVEGILEETSVTSVSTSSSSSFLQQEEDNCSDNDNDDVFDISAVCSSMKQRRRTPASSINSLDDYEQDEEDDDDHSTSNIQRLRTLEHCLDREFDEVLMGITPRVDQQNVPLDESLDESLDETTSSSTNNEEGSFHTKTSSKEQLALPSSPTSVTSSALLFDFCASVDNACDDDLAAYNDDNNSYYQEQPSSPSKEAILLRIHHLLDFDDPPFSEEPSSIESNACIQNLPFGDSPRRHNMDANCHSTTSHEEDSPNILSEIKRLNHLETALHRQLECFAIDEPLPLLCDDDVDQVLDDDSLDAAFEFSQSVTSTQQRRSSMPSLDCNHGAASSNWKPPIHVLLGFTTDLEHCLLRRQSMSN